MGATLPGGICPSYAARRLDARSLTVALVSLLPRGLPSPIPVPVGYTADQTNCPSVPLGGACTITNTLLTVVAIPTLSGWGSILPMNLLALVGFAVLRRQTILPE